MCVCVRVLTRALNRVRVSTCVSYRAPPKGRVCTTKGVECVSRAIYLYLRSSSCPPGRGPRGTHTHDRQVTRKRISAEKKMRRWSTLAGVTAACMLLYVARRVWRRQELMGDDQLEDMVAGPSVLDLWVGGPGGQSE